MDPGSRLALELLFREIKRVRRASLKPVDAELLELTLHHLLELATKISEELETRTVP